MKYSNVININQCRIKTLYTSTGLVCEIGKKFDLDEDEKTVQEIKPYCNISGIEKYILLSYDHEIIGSIESTNVVFIKYFD
jgi:hypothetical protein